MQWEHKDTQRCFIITQTTALGLIISLEGSTNHHPIHAKRHGKHFPPGSQLVGLRLFTDQIKKNCQTIRLYGYRKSPQLLMLSGVEDRTKFNYPRASLWTKNKQPTKLPVYPSSWPRSVDWTSSEAVAASLRAVLSKIYAHGSVIRCAMLSVLKISDKYNFMTREKINCQ